METGSDQIMEQDMVKQFFNRLSEQLGEGCTYRSEVDNKGVTFCWCKLDNASDIVKAAKLVAEFHGRIMTISALIAKDNDQVERVEINYHFYFDTINCTISIHLPGDLREIESITPILKSADWHEREMQDFYQIKLIGHPNPKRLFLDKNSPLEKNDMVPLSAAMNSMSTNTLWERIMKANGGGDVEK
jgi:Ni,Fe-hydrogenase III component G